MMMKEKILFFIEKEFLQFGISKYFQENLDYELYAIVDVNETLKKFFLEQKIVNFKQIWYFNDHISKKEPDIKYLKNFEEKYKIKLWEIVYKEKIFYQKFNKFYRFSDDEILSIIEQECKLFEKILNEVKPNFLITSTITRQHLYVLYRMCEQKNIKVLSKGWMRFGDRWAITAGFHFDIDEKINFDKKKYPKKTGEEIQNFLTSYRPRQGSLDLKKRGNEKILSEVKTEKKFGISKLQKIKAISQFMIEKKKYSYGYYTYGRTKFNVLTKGNAKWNSLKIKRRKQFIDKHFIKKIDDETKFVLYLIHVEPEIVLLMGAPYYTDQISVIRNIAKSMPIGYKLYVKEHPGQEEHGWREKSFYKEILSMPNVSIIHPFADLKKLMNQCSLVITIRGTASMEAAFYNTPSIVFYPELGYSLIPSIEILRNIHDLPDAINSSLEKKVRIEDLSDFLNYINEISFEFPYQKYSLEIAKRFNYSVGFLKEEEISQKQMVDFLREYSKIFEMLSNQYLKKINELKIHQINL